jgi:putative methyltransferase (TIGR04325 family)
MPRLREFVPPIAVTLARKVFPPRPDAARPTYATYEAAVADCAGHGYEDRDLVAVVRHKTQAYRNALGSALLSPANAYSLCALLASIQSPEIRVLDFGGACGAHYFLARAVLPRSYSLRWIVVETPAMAEAGTSLATAELTFSSDLRHAAESLGRVDLLHTSGTLQCVSDPRRFLDQLLALRATQILFNRLALCQGPQDIVVVQESRLSENGPGPMPSGLPDRTTRYPCTFLQESALYDALRQNYEVILTFEDSGGVFRIKEQPIIGRGLLARRKA